MSKLKALSSFSMQSLPQGRLARLLKSLLLLPLLSLPLAACATTGSLFEPTSSTEVRQLECSPARPITYSHTKDTPETVKQVRVHNKTYANLKCPGF